LDIHVASKSFNQSAQNLLEKNATLTIWQGIKAVRYITGVVASFGMTENNRWQMRYHFCIQPPLWRSGLRKNFRIFQQKDIHAISAILLDENGVTDWGTSFNEVHSAREFCVQYGESDLTFLSRLWAEQEIFFYDKFGSDEPTQKLTVCDDIAGLTRLKEAFTFNPDANAELMKECVRKFHYGANVRPSSILSKDYAFKTPDWEGTFNSQGKV
jgi:type VI secretion system secreted protein VgrG